MDEHSIIVNIGAHDKCARDTMIEFNRNWIKSQLVLDGRFMLNAIRWVKFWAMKGPKPLDNYGE